MNRFSFVLIAALAFVLPGAAMAATVDISPTTVSVTPGKTFTVTLTADPAGAKVYTTRANVSFDPALVSVTGFTLAPKWLALQASGYDAIDNAGGTLIKTAGYPGGLTAPTVFGTVTFTAKAAGTATVQITSKSMMLDDTSTNTLAGTQGSAVVTIAAPAQKLAPAETAPVAKPVVKPVVKAAKSVAVETTVATTSEVATTSDARATSTIATTSALAAAGAAGFSLGTMTYVWLAVLVLVAIAGWAWYRRRIS